MESAEQVLALFDSFRSSLEESNAVREKIRMVVADLDSTTRQMHAALLPIHSGQNEAVKQAVSRAKENVPDLKRLYASLADIIRERPGQYYRYHDHWRNVTNTVVFLLAFLHWLESGALLSHREAESQLEMDRDQFWIDLEDYLIGICSLSNEMPRYVVNRVTAGDYECPHRVSAFLNQLYSAFRLLNLRNDNLRKRFDGLKYDVKRVEEVLYDVKIRGLDSKAKEEAEAMKG